MFAQVLLREAILCNESWLYNLNEFIVTRRIVNAWRLHFRVHTETFFPELTSVHAHTGYI